MIKGIARRRSVWIAAAAFGVACGGTEPTPPAPAPAPSVGTLREPIVYFEGTVDIATHQMDISYRTPLGEPIAPPELALIAASPLGIDLPSGTTPGKVYFNTQGGAATWQGVCGALTLCGQVRAVNGYTASLTNVIAVIDSIVGTSVTAPGAPWQYGTVSGSSASAFQTWSFSDPNNISFSFKGHGEGTPPVGFSPFVEAREPNTTGNQGFAQGLGQDFTIAAPINVTYMGAYDSGNDGLALTISVMIFNLSNSTVVAGTSQTLSGSSLPLVGNYRYLKLGSPVTLPAGSYSVVAYGYGATEQNRNSNVGGSTTANLDTAGGRVAYGQSRFGNNPGTLPSSLFATPGAFGAGSFVFE